MKGRPVKVGDVLGGVLHRVPQPASMKGRPVKVGDFSSIRYPVLSNVDASMKGRLVKVGDPLAHGLHAGLRVDASMKGRPVKVGDGAVPVPGAPAGRAPQ